MKTLTAVFTLLCIIILLSGGVVLAAAPASQETAAWKDYQDPDYGFSVQYNADDWEPKVTVYTPNNPDPQVIAKRVSFFGPSAQISIDVWEHPENDLIGWVSEDSAQRGVPKDTVTINAEVAGLLAVAYFESYHQAPSVMSTVFSDDRYFFRIQYVIGDGGAGKDIYFHMLRSFSLNDNTFQDAFQFPAEIQDKASQSQLMVSTCCGYTWAGNPFPCDNGNCTWWAYYRQGSVPFTGDAWTWWGQVPRFSDWRRSTTTPVVGGLAWWNQSAGRPLGHVAQVLSISGDNINVSEMTWQGNPCSEEPVYRAYATNNPNGYIYWVGP